jgi:putative membrane protein
MKILLVSGVAFAFATSAFAQQPTTQQQTQPRSETQSQAPSQNERRTSAVPSSGSEDIEFVLDAAKGGMAEVELGKLAADHAKNDEVKKFAQRMVDDHSKANDELKSIAEAKGIKLPTDTDATHKATMRRLEKLNGAAFDRAYMQMMVGDHVKDVNEFKKESNSGRDSQVKAFASSKLPTLEEHLQQARAARTAANSEKATAAGN